MSACPIRVPENLKEHQIMVKNLEGFRKDKRRETKIILNSSTTLPTIHNYQKRVVDGLQTQLGVIIIPGGFDSHLPPLILYS